MALGAASAWMVAGRASGLLWTVLLIATLGIGDFGVYAGAYALAAIVSAPIENIFVVRCVRVTEDEFRAERSLRALIGGGLALTGVAIYALSFFAGFALVVAGAEMVFNAYKSASLRMGRPGAIMRMDAFRQLSSIVIASAYLFAAGDHATLAIACLWYLAPYLVVCVLTARTVAGTRPAGLRQWRQHLVLVVDALVLSVYLQGDILLLGVLADDEVVGLYSFASQLALAASTVGQLYGQQFAASLRAHEGRADAGAPLRATIGLGVLISLGVAAAGLVVAALPEYRHFALVVLLISPFAGLRAITNVWVTALHVKTVDVPRIGWSALALVMRFGLLIGMVLCGVNGAVAAALAAVAGEALLTVFFARLMAFGRGQRGGLA